MVRFEDSVVRQDYRPFDGAHPDRSSQVFISDDAQAVLKYRPKQQSEEKFMREFLSLLAWNRLLDYYNGSADADSTIESPRPLALSLEDRSIYMSFMSGETIGRAYAMTQAELGGLAVRDLIGKSAYRLGRLFSIKQHEQLLHGDFQPRHLLVGRTAVLSVIDVESSSLGEPDDVVREHRALYGRVLRSAAGWKQDTFVEGFSEGQVDFRPGARNIVEDVLADVNLGEKPDYNINLFKNGS